MSTSTFVVRGHWRGASPSANVRVETKTATGTHAPFTPPSAPEPVRTAVAPTRTPHDAFNDAIDDFFGVRRLRATRESQHDSHPFLGGELPPPPYADVELPAYSAGSNTEPITLAMHLFKFGFLFPLLWVLGAIILISPLSVPVDFEPSKSGTERRQLARVIRNAEVRWATRCALALVALLVLVGIIIAISFVALRL